MSRTIRGNKGAGFEYWGKRPTKGHYPPGKAAKKLTHKIERRHVKDDAEAQLNEALDGTQFTKYIDWYEGYYGTY